MPDGKIEVEAIIRLDGSVLEGAKTYVYIKGYSRARVTHVDIEHPRLKEILPPRHSDYPFVKWSGRRVEIPVKGHMIEVESNLLGSLVGFEGNLYVGGKGKEVFLGFHREQISKLEELGRTKGFPSLSRGKTPRK